MNQTRQQLENTMIKIIFFDLDGTLREAASGKTFINEPTDQKPIEGTQKALAYYQSKGFTLIGITNQGGVAAGHKSLESAIEEQRITLELFPELLKVYISPDFEGNRCICVDRKSYADTAYPQLRGKFRKPEPGMIQIQFESCNLPPKKEKCWMIGDRPEDEACAAAAGVKFVWASVMHAQFAGPGMEEIDCQHIPADVLMEFLAL